jgi:hypothetical protein
MKYARFQKVRRQVEFIALKKPQIQAAASDPDRSCSYTKYASGFNGEKYAPVAGSTTAWLAQRGKTSLMPTFLAALCMAEALSRVTSTLLVV